MVAAAPTDDVLVRNSSKAQDRRTASGSSVWDNDVKLRFCHEELRSVPRRGGSGTHLRIRRDDALKRAASELLRSIGWHGIALVEFRRRDDGSLVLMEVNPKFWASYALASEHGYRFASTMVAVTLDLGVDVPIGSPEPVGEMVYPLRELYHCARRPTLRSARECLGTILEPNADWSVDRNDPGAWLTPPVELVRKIPALATPRSDGTGLENASGDGSTADEDDYSIENSGGVR